MKHGSEKAIKLNRSWFIFYGSKFGMSRKETLATLYCELMDLINCDQIDRGIAMPEEEEKKWSFDEVMNLK